MLHALSLRGKIIGIFIAMIVIVSVGEGGMLWYTYHMDDMLDTMVEKEFLLYRTGQDMELALANQKGLLTYYLVDGDSKWLKSLGQQREKFNRYLEQAKTMRLNAEQREMIENIAQKFDIYTAAKDVAIENYQSIAKLGSVSNLHEKQREIFFSLLEQCRTFSREQWLIIDEMQKAGDVLTKKMRIAQLSAIAIFTILCMLFLFILYKYILGPIRGLAIKTGGSPQESYWDEVDSLAHSLKGMMREFDETSDELAKSRRHLLQVERMAMVGELAAGVAHTIRNPFTSIKMRMFSLTRSLDLNVVQNEDLQVISDEITRIDRIVQNFLEFARPPKLRLEACHLGDVIRSVLTLLDYRLKAYNVEVSYTHQPDLPPIKADADRIKEALVNLLINACEAMDGGGKIDIAELRTTDPELGEIATIVVRDTGPGIPAAIIDKVTTPFFTTKEEGSGLGLSIVSRIAREHRGKFIIVPAPSQGVECILQLPAQGIRP
ncbi:MAG: ATP-binding protein [Pseudomonadota bacterium]